MSYAQAKLAVEVQAATPLGAMLVQWPEGPILQPDGAPYAEVHHLTGQTSVDTLGTRGYDLVPGITQINLYYPLETSPSVTVDTFRASFGAGQWLTHEGQAVLIRSCGPGPTTRDSTYEKSIVEIRWEARIPRLVAASFESSCVLRVPRDIEYPAPKARRFVRFWRDPADPDPGLKSGLKLPADSVLWTTVLHPVFTLLPTSSLLTVAFSAQFTVPAGVGAFSGIIFRMSAQQGATVQYFPGAGDEFASFIARRTDNGDGLQVQGSYVGSLEVAPGLSTDIKVQCQADVANCYVLFAGLNLSY